MLLKLTKGIPPVTKATCFALFMVYIMSFMVDMTTKETHGAKHHQQGQTNDDGLNSQSWLQSFLVAHGNASGAFFGLSIPVTNWTLFPMSLFTAGMYETDFITVGSS